MEKIDLTKEFAMRLRESMIASGYSSPRSTYGVNIHKLAEITGYSTQICRKYLRGEVIPEPRKLTEIASKLNVAPGWLLFGDSHSHSEHISENKITINRDILHYIFTHINTLLCAAQPNQALPDFFMSLTNDISQIDTNIEQSKKIIDLALRSARHFSQT